MARKKQTNTQTNKRKRGKDKGKEDDVKEEEEKVEMDVELKEDEPTPEDNAEVKNEEKGDGEDVDNADANPSSNGGDDGMKLKSVDGRESEIRFGALEIVAAYTGDEEELPYSFVLLSNDIMYGDDDTDVVDIQWMGFNKEGNLVLEDIDDDEIAVGSMIKAVTTDVIELNDGSYQVPKAVHQAIKTKLEKQLSDDYDPEADSDNDEPNYEARMRKKRRIKVKDEPKKRGRKKRVKEESDAEMEDLDFHSDNDEKSKTKKTKTVKSKAKTVKTSAAGSKKKKGGKNKLCPRDEMEEVEDPWYQKTGKIDAFNGDTHRASKEVIRSYLAKDNVVFQKLLKDGKNIADLFAYQSTYVQKSVYDYAITLQDKEVFDLLLKEMKSDKKTPRAPFPVCSLAKFSSGQHTSRYADRNRYNVGASRGGKEGNNAFMADVSGNSYFFGRSDSNYRIDLVELLETHDSISISFLEHLNKEIFDGNLFRWGFDFHSLISSGHRELAHHAMKTLIHRDVGLNNLHVETLAEEEKTLEKFRAVSVIKKSADCTVRLTPIHCAASNPNPTYLKQLLAVSPEAIDTLDSQEAGILHYAAVGEKPDTLKWILEGPGSSMNRNTKLRKGNKTTPLMWAAKACRPDNVRLLCGGGSYEKASEMFKIKDVRGMMAFHYVAKSYRKGRFDTARALIECGADPNIRGDTRLLQKQTPLMICAAKGDLQLLKVLVGGGGDITLVDKLERDLLMLSAKNGNIHIMSYLLKLGMSVEAVDSSENTALHYACAYGWVDCVKLLIDTGAPIDAKNSWSSTALELALKKGRSGCAVLMLKQNVDVNVLDKDGVSLFNSLISSYMGQLSQQNEVELPWAVQKIMDREDLDVTTKDTLGRNLLHYIANGAKKCGVTLSNLVKDLLARGIDPLSKDNNGQVPAELALRNKNLELCLLFLQHSSHGKVGDGQKDKDNMIQLLIPSIIEDNEDLFVQIFDLLYELNSGWANKIYANGKTLLMTATETVRKSWTTTKPKGRKALEHLFEKLNDQLGVALARRPEYREWNDKLIHCGKPNWRPDSVYFDGSRTILHEILLCPDIEWAFKMSKTVLQHLKGDMINLKTNSNKDAVGFAFDTFVTSTAAIDPIVRLLKLLQDHGAHMNAVTHPLFSSLSEAEKGVAKVIFDASKKNIEDAIEFVRYEYRDSISKLLNNEKRRFEVDSTLFLPRVHQLLKGPENQRPSPELLLALMEECGLDPDIKDMMGNTSLHSFKDAKYLESLIAKSDVNAEDKMGNTALILGISDMNRVRRLIESGANVNAVNNLGQTPLILSVSNIDRIQLLIDNGARVDMNTKIGTVLHAAVKGGHNDVVELLLKSCNVNPLDKEKRTPLHYAVSRGATSTKETLNPIESQLIVAGANINALDQYGRSPIFYTFFPTNVDTKCKFPPASTRDPIDMITTLTSRPGVKLDVVDEDRRTPLHYAAAVGASICVLFFCEKCENIIENKDLDNNTALGLSLLAKRADTSILLISKDSILNISVTETTRKRVEGEHKVVGTKVCSSLEVALRCVECESVARYILAATKLSMNTILTAAFSTGNLSLALNQIKLCPSPKLLRVPDETNGKTALHKLADVRSFDHAPGFACALSDALINAGLKTSTKSKMELTALHIACLNGHMDLCRNLISNHGDSVDVEDSKGSSPLVNIFNSGKSISHDLLFLLADASKDAKAYVNAVVQGKADLVEDQMWKDKANLQKTLFTTPLKEQHSEEAFIQRLKAERKIFAAGDKVLAKTNGSSYYSATVKEVNGDKVVVKYYDDTVCELASSNVQLDTDNIFRVKDKYYTVSSTMLIESVKKNNLTVANILLSYGADGSMSDQNGRTALHHAVMQKSKPLVWMLLKWNRVPLNIVDKFGLTAMSYAVLSSLKSTPCETLELLLEFGADPLVGKALLFTIKANMTTLAQQMLICSRRKLIKKSAPSKKSCKVGDVVWTRYSNMSPVWNLVQVESTGRSDCVVSCQISTEKKQGTMAVNKQPQSLPRSTAILGVPKACICEVDMEVDAPESLRSSVMSLLDDKTTKEEKEKILKDYEGSEGALLKIISKGPKRDSLISPLAKNDLIGYLEDLNRLIVGKVTNVYPNGQYDIELFTGRALLAVDRTKLRRLRKGLQIKTEAICPNFDAEIIHAFVRPFKYGSYDNKKLLQEFIDAGAPATGKNNEGKTPVEEARPGSEIQDYLCEVTKTKKPPALPYKSVSMITENNVNYEADAELESKRLLESESGNTEVIVPDIIPVCQHELNKDSADNCVLADGSRFFDVSLSKVDVMQGQYGKYNFYRMQIAHLPMKDTYVLLTNWGRIGEDGKYQQTPFTSRDDAIKEFCKVFKSKTGNVWSERESFEKRPGKYRLIKIQEKRLKNPEKLIGEALVETHHPCSIVSKPVGDLLRFLLDIKSLLAAYENSGIDECQIPFGQLTVSSIEVAEKKLQEIRDKIKTQNDVKGKGTTVELREALEAVAKATSEFYELLPMGSDMIVTPFVENDRRFGQAVNLIRLLRDLSITKQILLGAMHRQNTMNPIDYAYSALRVDIKVLEKDSIERKCLLRYIDNTCSDGNTVIKQIYTLDDGKEACDIPNKRLLFHGSQNSNIPGIMKHGLLIAPPEAPHSGFAYGKGVYFADQFSKAYGYSSGHSQPRSFVFVAEVALGESYLPTGCEYMEKPKEGSQSTHALGSSKPDDTFDMAMHDTGSIISLGETKQSTNSTKKSTSFWTKGEPVYRWGSCYSPRPQEEEKIEKVRLDPNTEFPALVSIMDGHSEQQVTLLAPGSKRAKMVPAPKADEEKEEDDSNMEVDGDESNIRISSFGNSSNIIKSNSINTTNTEGITLVRSERDQQQQHLNTYSEFIVYDTKQIRLKYLIEVTNQNHAKSDFLKEADIKVDDDNTNINGNNCDEDSNMESDEESDEDSDMESDEE